MIATEAAVQELRFLIDGSWQKGRSESFYSITNWLISIRSTSQLLAFG